MLWMTSSCRNRSSGDAGPASSEANIACKGLPGVGKTYVAKRLAYVLLGDKDPTRVDMVQFHQCTRTRTSSRVAPGQRGHALSWCCRYSR